MDLSNVSIQLDHPIFYSSEKVTGKVILRIREKQNWEENCRIFLKLYDDIDVEWLATANDVENITSRGTVFLRRKEYQVNEALLLDKKDISKSEGDTIYWSFEFDLPEKMQGTLRVEHARCRYFIKAYLSTDESVYTHYKHNVNVSSVFFRSLDHKFAKREVIVHNRLSILQLVTSKEVVVESRTDAMKVTVKLPKSEYTRNEAFKVNIFIESLGEVPFQSMYKIAFKLFQSVKLKANFHNNNKAKRFENLIVHTTRRFLKENLINGILVDEYVPIPREIPSSSSRHIPKVTGSDLVKPHMNPFRVDYKLSIEFWITSNSSDLEINIPMLIDPEK